MNDNNKPPLDNQNETTNVSKAVRDDGQQAGEINQEPVADKGSDSARSNQDDVPEKTAQETSENRSPRRRQVWPTLLVLGLLVIATVVTLSWGIYQGYQRFDRQDTELAALTQALQVQKQRISDGDAALQSQMESQNRRLQAVQQALTNSQNALGDLEQRVSAQGKRLLAMSDVSRDDWLLAEAEYLLKLANQRIRIERSADGAEALLEEADIILRDLADPDLHPLRRAVAEDLAALRLMKKIDVEGIYLSLVALAGQVETLPVQPSREQEQDNAELTQLDLEEEQSLTFWQRVKRSWQGFISGLGNYFRVIPHDELPEILLLPEESHYLQHNLRLMLERAQLALLREQGDIYRQSLTQAAVWMDRYYPKTQPSLAFVQELEKLQEKTVVQIMPDISGSLLLLNEYIDNLHKLKGNRPSTSDAAQPTGAGDS